MKQISLANPLVSWSVGSTSPCTTQRGLRCSPSVLAMMRAGVLQRGLGTLGRLMHGRAIYPVFQPIVALSDASVYAHEALIRGPQATPLHSPDALLAAAAREKLNFEFENQCVSVALERWGALQEPGRLFVNISAEVLVQVMKQCGTACLLNMVQRVCVLPRLLVLEITEHERVSDMDCLAEVVSQVRATGVSLALDDFGDGRSSLRLWSQLKPEIVKIDKYFTKDISHHADKVKTIQALQQIAAIFDTALVAEGIETEDDLRVLRDLGIAYGQGYFLGRPAPSPLKDIGTVAQAAIRDRRLAIYPEMRRSATSGQLKQISAVAAPAVALHTTNDAVAAIFVGQPDLHAVAVIDCDRPVGIINRTHFLNEYTKLYYREVCGGKSCAMHINSAPRLIERNHNVDELIGILTSTDQRYLSDGFIVTDNGRYAGLGTGDQLVRSVMETRIEAARHANPLTFLPGNIPITQHIERLLAAQTPFVACYADLNHFKPFNDQYGYWRGDEMIRLVARLAQANCDPLRDFVGHVGGDDFIILYQSADWEFQCQRIVEAFALAAVGLFDVPAREAGGIEAEDRHGVQRFFPLTTISIGAVNVAPGLFYSAEQVASEAARAKHDAKMRGQGLLIRDCRQEVAAVSPV